MSTAGGSPQPCVYYPAAVQTDFIKPTVPTYPPLRTTETIMGYRDDPELTLPPHYYPPILPVPSEEALAQEPKTRRSRIRKHVIRLLVFVAIYFVFFSGARGFRGFGFWHGDVDDEYLVDQFAESYYDHYYDDHLASNRPHHPKPTNCLTWHNNTNDVDQSTFLFNISTSAHLIKFIADGPFVGSVDFVQADEKASNESIIAKIELSQLGSEDADAHHPHGRKPRPLKVRLCTLSDSEGEANGLGLFGFGRHRHHSPPPRRPTRPPGRRPPPPPENPSHRGPPRGIPLPPRSPHDPHHQPAPREPHYPPPPPSHHHRDHVHPHPIAARVTVYIPTGYLSLGDLEGWLPGFSINAGAGVLDDTTFNRVGLMSVNGAINIANLAATTASIVTVNQPINGTFFTSDKLSLVTTNAAIDVNVTLANGATQEHPTVVKIVTTNAPITSLVNLVLFTDDSGLYTSGGSYAVHATTTNAPLSLAVAEQPTSSLLRLEAITTHSNASVVLPPAFEGSFELIAVHGSSDVKTDETAKDPSGEDRSRVVQVKNVFGGIVKGSVEWVERGKEEEAREGMKALAEVGLEDEVMGGAGSVKLITTHGDLSLLLDS